MTVYLNTFIHGKTVEVHGNQTALQENKHGKVTGYV